MTLISENQIFEKEYSLFDQKYIEIRHKSGLKICFCPKQCATTWAQLGVHYGSLDLCFSTDKRIQTPTGTAHYLEHKMFDCEDGQDVSQKFARLGADVNAYTTEEDTVFLFSTTDHFQECLETLLHFVTVPYFTSELVAKERPIIAEEIRMYEDSPENQLLYALYRGMYKKHPIRKDIAGTQSSIRRITPETLYLVHRTFYKPSNMTLCICGNVPIEEIVEACDQVLPTEKEEMAVQKQYFPENQEVFQSRTNAYLDITTSRCAIGIKDTIISDDPLDRMQKLAKMRMLSEILFGASSSFSEELYRSGIISSPLYINSEHTERISYLQLIADCQQPDLFFSRFCQFTEEKKLCGISEEEFERNRRSAYGSFIMSLEYSESVADLLTEYAADKINLFSYAETMLTITKSQIEELMFSLFRLPNYCLASLDPIKNRKE